MFMICTSIRHDLWPRLVPRSFFRYEHKSGRALDELKLTAVVASPTGSTHRPFFSHVHHLLTCLCSPPFGRHFIFHLKGNGFCDDYNNREECAWDGGDVSRARLMGVVLVSVASACECCFAAVRSALLVVAGFADGPV